ncbi:unnamed protein product [Ectocarpus sp. 6 AP-2014]
MHGGPDSVYYLEDVSIVAMTMSDSRATEEQERMWAFYRNESGKCASKLCGPPRHFDGSSTGSWAGRGAHLKTCLPPRRTEPAAVIRAAVAATRAAAVVVASTGLAFPRGRRRRLSWMTQTCSTAVRSFPLAGYCVRPLSRGQERGGGLQLGSVLLDTPGPSLQQRSGGGDGDVDGGMGLMGNTSGDESLTTEDAYVLASLKRAIVELYDTCHRLLSFEMLNYTAFVRMMELELHVRRVGPAGIVGAPPETETETAVVGRQDDPG